MADGGNVIFKFLADDKALKKTLSGLGSAFKTALKGVATRNGSNNGWFCWNSNGKCKSKRRNRAVFRWCRNTIQKQCRYSNRKCK